MMMDSSALGRPRQGKEPKVKLDRLIHTDEQKALIDQIYRNTSYDSQKFSETDTQQQELARKLLDTLGLNRGAREQLESWWSIRWSNGWSLGDPKTGDERRRILFQW
ncbi:hypothetical protein HGRIS_002283 [Hohenbuehelia grisea]|uniref:Uncharacterized protein n=1 Tax=Hohenbuehelia grisea TaxID=104357 RepID=A0ABR3JKW5_9AGAR